MRVVTTRTELEQFRDKSPRGRAAAALVPTMGALHDGHRTLIIRARAHESVCVSIFVNPLQFGPAEDFTRYPRPIEADLAMCAAEGVDLVFAPTNDEMYAGGAPRVTVHAGPLGDLLEGTTRPGHFDGVLTVVAKLFHLVRPEVAFFGQKDAQQLALIRQMVRELDFPVEVVGAPTVREPDGLAISSRNSYLGSDQRQHAVALVRALQAGRAAQHRGPAAVLAQARSVIDAASGVRLDYLELVDADTFGAVDEHTERGLLLVAAYVGGTRLIDNVTLDLPGTTGMYSKET
jgi:pantoate--beta-alanine ligase